MPQMKDKVNNQTVKNGDYLRIKDTGEVVRYIYTTLDGELKCEYYNEYKHLPYCDLQREELEFPTDNPKKNGFDRFERSHVKDFGFVRVASKSLKKDTYWVYGIGLGYNERRSEFFEAHVSELKKYELRYRFNDEMIVSSYQEDEL